MYINYKYTVIAGVIAGILIGLMSIMGCFCFPVDILVLLGAGVLPVYMSRDTIKESNDLMVNGGLAGLIGGGLGGILYTIASVLTWSIASLTLGSDYYRYYRTICGASPPSPLQSAAVGMVCCLPTFLVAGIVLGVAGAFAYHWLKNKPAAAST